MMSNGELGPLGGGLLAFIAGIAILAGVDNDVARIFGAMLLVVGIVVIIIFFAGMGRKS